MNYASASIWCSFFCKQVNITIFGDHVCYPPTSWSVIDVEHIQLGNKGVEGFGRQCLGEEISQLRFSGNG
jgi:hypothetical protein